MEKYKKPELVEESEKLPFIITLTAKQEFAQKSEKPLCLAATIAMRACGETGEAGNCHNLLGEEKSVTLPVLPENKNIFSLPFQSTVSTSHCQSLTWNHKGRDSGKYS